MQQSQNINQSKTRSKISAPEGSAHHDKVIAVSNYTIPQTMSEHDPMSRTIRRKGMQDIRREIPAYADPMYRPLQNQLEYLYK